MPSLELIPCFLIVVGLGWVFAEVRRFFVQTYYFLREADENQRGNIPVSLTAELFLLSPSSHAPNAIISVR